MGSAIGDYDGDGDLDWFVSSIFDGDGVAEGDWGTTGNRLYRNRGDGSFEDATSAAGVRDANWGWGASFADFDNDGRLDLVRGQRLATGLAAVSRFAVAPVHRAWAPSAAGASRNGPPRWDSTTRRRARGGLLRLRPRRRPGYLRRQQQRALPPVPQRRRASRRALPGGDAARARRRTSSRSARSSASPPAATPRCARFAPARTTSRRIPSRRTSAWAPRRRVDRLEVTWPGGAHTVVERRRAGPRHDHHARWLHALAPRRFRR